MSKNKHLFFNDIYFLSYNFFKLLLVFYVPTTSDVKFRHILKIHPVYHVL
jgi:hypothetical protein